MYTQKSSAYYCIYHKYCDRQTWANSGDLAICSKYWDSQASENSADPDQMQQNVASDLAQIHLPLIQQF